MTAWNNEAFSPEALAALFGGLQGTDTVSVDAEGGTPGVYTHTFTSAMRDAGWAQWNEAIAEVINEMPLLKDNGVRLMVPSPDVIYLSADMRNKLRWWRYGNAKQRARLSTQTRRRSR